MDLELHCITGNSITNQSDECLPVLKKYKKIHTLS